LLLLCALGALFSCGARQEQSVHVAVAANFTEAAKELARRFREETGNSAVLSFGSTGQLFTQITQGAPFEIFLAADRETPKQAVEAGLGVKDSLFTYAVGKIVLYSKQLDLSAGDAVLREGHFEKIAIANPETAPYGAAAVEAMESLGVYVQLAQKIVRGNNIAQTFQFVDTGNAEVGFVALSQVSGKDAKSIWVVPDSLYSQIGQDAVLLKKGAANPTARAFIVFLKSPEALRIIEKYGYGGTL
jgi:molybdate transport system substrate-binding protein